ncbi:MAG TPA: SulP family inorganic anion transporter, partial [Pirellulales bacterium]|nr:SulP family inorganic anion transporter [Pirellulales bacterium]
VGQLIVERGYAALGLIIIVGGVLQFVAGLMRLGQWFRAVCPAVIHGMLAGIGVLILAAQFHVMVDDAPPGSGVEFGGIINLVTIPTAVWKGLSESIHRPAASIGVLTIATIMAWVSFAPRRLKFLPAPLMGAIVATATAGILALDIRFITVPDNLAAVISPPALSDWRLLLDWSIIGAGAALAFVASAESLLSAAAADTMQSRAPRTKYDRELAAQGVGNIVSGFLGALPMTGVIVRTATNIQSGAQTRASSILHGVWLLVFAVLFPQALRLIPIAGLAAILVYTGWKLIKPKSVVELWKLAKGEAAIYVATLSTVVIVDLLTGILVGIGLAVLKLVYTFSHLTIRIAEDHSQARTMLHLNGAATFLRLPKLAAALESVPSNVELHVDFEGLTYIDHACLDLLMNWEKVHMASGGSLVIDWDSLTARFHARRNGNGEGRVAEAPPKTAAVEHLGSHREKQYAEAG